MCLCLCIWTTFLSSHHLSRYTYSMSAEFLQRLLENRLFAKAEKCMFHAQSVTFLGSVVSAEGISMDPDKVRAVIDWPVPDSRVALQRFLGFANFLTAVLIRNFSQVAAPLTFLTSSKTRFAWSEAAQGAFDRLKGLFTSAPILITPDPENNLLLRLMPPTSGLELSCRNALPLTTRFIRALSIHIAFRPLSATTTSVTESFWRSVWR